MLIPSLHFECMNMKHSALGISNACTNIATEWMIESIYPFHLLQRTRGTEKKIAIKWKFICTAQVHELFDFRRGYYIFPFSIENWNAPSGRGIGRQWHEKQTKGWTLNSEHNRNRQVNICLHRDKLNILNSLYAFFLSPTELDVYYCWMQFIFCFPSLVSCPFHFHSLFFFFFMKLTCIVLFTWWNCPVPNANHESWTTWESAEMMLWCWSSHKKKAHSHTYLYS